MEECGDDEVGRQFVGEKCIVRGVRVCFSVVGEEVMPMTAPASGVHVVGG